MSLAAKQTPLPTGNWGRPAQTRRRRASSDSQDGGGDLRISEPPPPPPAVFIRRSPRGLLRQRPGGVALELLISVAVLVAVSVGVGASSGRTGTPAASHTWSGRALPVLTSLVDDLTTRDPRAPLLSDDSRAHALGSPGEGLDAQWSVVLSRVDAAVGDLETQSGPSQQRSEEALNALLAFVASLERGPG